MPVYEYRCESCDYQFELRQKFSDLPVELCPQCGGTVRKLVSAVSFSLKGSGWYGDGYGTAQSETAPATESEASGTAAEPSTDGVPKDSSTPAAETSSAETQSSTAQVETKGQTADAAAEPPTRDKVEPKPATD